MVFIHILGEGHLDCVSFLALNKAPVNILYKWLRGPKFLFLLGEKLGVEWLGHVCKSFSDSSESSVEPDNNSRLRGTAVKRNNGTKAMWEPKVSGTAS